MKRPETARVYLLAPRIWRPFVEQALGHLSEQMRNYAFAVVKLTHSRHVGLPVELAADLVPLLLSPKVRDEAGNPWLSIFNRLREDLEQHRLGRSARAGGRTNMGLLWHAHPSWCVLKLVLPLMGRISREIGKSFLFCEEHVDTTVTSDHYLNYVSKVKTRLIHLSQSRGDGYDLFWQDRALTLATLSTGVVTREALPEADGAALGMLLRLSPDDHEDHRQSRRLRNVSASHKQKRTWRIREGGFDGIHLTRRPEDLDGILLSEFANPDFLLTDRLLNTGYFALERSPKREKLKDVFVVAVMPGITARSLVGDFVKACWFEAMARLGHMLRSAGLGASAFSWMQGDTRGRLYNSTFHLDKLPSFARVNDPAAGRAWRREFMSALGWVPHLFSPEARAQVEVGADGGEHARALEWVTQAWKQAVAQGLLNGNRTGPGSFSFLHIMVLLPAADPETAFTPDLGHVLSELALNNQAGRHVSLTCIPAVFDQPGNWHFAAGGRGGRALFDPEHPPADERAVATALIRNWMEQFTKEIWRV